MDIYDLLMMIFLWLIGYDKYLGLIDYDSLWLIYYDYLRLIYHEYLQLIDNNHLQSIDYSWYDLLQMIDHVHSWSIEHDYSWYDCLQLFTIDWFWLWLFIYNWLIELINYDCDVFDEISTSGAMYPCVPTLAWGLFLLKHWEFILQ